MNIKFVSTCLFLCLFSSCGPYKKFEKSTHPPAPVYADEKNWVALPWRTDIADSVPQGCSIGENQQNAKADVFFIHPTLYMRGRKWNASLNRKFVNTKTEFSIKNQASVFNAAGRVFAPRYRQAVIKAFYKKQSGNQALDLAYEDIKAAFEYYLKNWNNGRPIILAGHSQGAQHTIRLLKEFFDGKDLQKQLVAAYPIGIPFKKSELKNIPISINEKQTGCYITWNTFKWNSDNKLQRKIYDSVPCVNPLTMDTSRNYLEKKFNKGGVGFNKFKLKENVCDAQIHGNVLWIHRAKKFGFSKLGNSYHLFDINLFYMNLRANAVLRTEEYFKNKK